jgi:hypothetical protein
VADIASILVVALLPVHASAPSTFTISGFSSLENCEYARSEVTRQHRPVGPKVILWSVCVPSAPPKKETEHGETGNR